MARDTKNPDVLRELFAALDDDPFLIAECLARPVLVDRLARDWYARDARFHGSVKQEAEEALETFPGDAVWMPDLGGEYHETEWRRGAEHSAAIERLAALPINRVSSLTEESDRFIVTAVLSRGEDRIRTATVAWNKRPFDSWWAEDGTRAIQVESEGGPDLHPVLPPVGGFHPVSAPVAALATDTWTATSTGDNVPAARFVHTAVWTGAEMIVWGGVALVSGDWVNPITGGLYDPATNSWTATSTASGVPLGRHSYAAVWTGREMIVWGGLNNSHGYLNDGGLYLACEGGSVATWYLDTDGDGYGLSSTGVPSCAQPAGYVAAGGDCAADDPDIHPGAAEINDGLDNQCPGDYGYGVVDEVGGVSGFHNPGDRDEFSWTAQAGATNYEVARCAEPQFSSACTKETTSATSWSDGEPVAQGDCHHYLVRALTPHPGSWGAASAGERTGICP